MPILLGPRATVDLLFNVGGIDAGRILNFENANGMNVTEIMQQLGSALGTANETLFERYGGLLYVTTDQFTRYRQGEGTATSTPVKAEFSPAAMVRSAETGHMLPLREFEDALGWTYQYLRDAYPSQVDADIQLIVERWMNRIDLEILTRIFSETEYPQGASGGYSVPWAIGTGVNVPYIPPSWSDVDFDSTHSHFLYANSTVTATALKSMLDNMILQLRHHGFAGRLVALVSDADFGTWLTVDGFVKMQPPGFQIIQQAGSTDSTAAVQVQAVTGEINGFPGELFGYYNGSRGVVELRYWSRIPTGYIFLTKSYGTNNPQNGVALRLHPREPFGLRPKIGVTSTLAPEIEYVQMRGMHGVGINRRLNGVAGYIADGATEYVNPTIG